MKENVLSAIILRPIVNAHDLPGTTGLEGPTSLIPDGLPISEIVLDGNVALLYFDLLQLIL